MAEIMHLPPPLMSDYLNFRVNICLGMDGESHQPYERDDEEDEQHHKRESESSKDDPGMAASLVPGFVFVQSAAMSRRCPREPHPHHYCNHDEGDQHRPFKACDSSRRGPSGSERRARVLATGERKHQSCSQSPPDLCPVLHLFLPSFTSGSGGTSGGSASCGVRIDLM